MKVALLQLASERDAGRLPDALRRFARAPGDPAR